MRFLLSLCMLSVFCSLSKAHATETETLLFGAVAYPPYTIQARDGLVRGTDADLAYEVFKRLDIPVKIILYPWKRVLQLTETGKLTGALTCSPRPQDYLLSAPISKGTDALYVRTEFDLKQYPISNASDLLQYPHLRIGGVSGYKHLEILDRLNLTYDLSPDDASAFKKLFANRLDIILTIQEYADYTILNDSPTPLAKTIPLSTKPYHVCFSKKWPRIRQLREKFNQTLSEIREDGTYDRIQAKYK